MNEKISNRFGRMFLSQSEVVKIYNYILNRSPSKDEKQYFIENVIKRKKLSKKEFISQLLLSAEFLNHSIKDIIKLHLYYIHQARIKMVMRFLPKAKCIVDLGGANCPIYDMNYPYSSERITIVDLPPEHRHEMYKNIELKPLKRPNTYLLFGSMTDLSAFSNNSIDLVWSGQSIEHITEEESKLVYKEVLRILKPGGFFCLDTPNRLITEIHTAPIGGGWIHPEHKTEYYPKQLRKNLIEAGFEIVEERGICEMPNTFKNKKFDYTDFILGNPLSKEVDSAYIQYYKCQKI